MSGSPDGTLSRAVGGREQAVDATRKAVGWLVSSGDQPPTRQRCHLGKDILGRWLAMESVVRWSICGDGPTDCEGRPRCLSNHVDEFLE